MKELCLYTQRPIHRIIKEVFVDFEIHIIKKEDLKKNKFTNIGSKNS